MNDTSTGIYGLRLIRRSGSSDALRVLAAIVWLGVLAQAVIIHRPDLIHPTDFGSDTSNYAAAGERILRSSIYSLSPGDRPVPADNPPQWTVPILSPPTLAASWAALLLAPDSVRFLLPWAVGLAATCAMGLVLIVRLPLVPMLASLLLLSGGLGAVAWAGNITAWSGNINALFGLGLMAVWFLSSSDRSRRARVAAGIIVAVLALAKLGPVILGLWLLTQRRIDSVVAAVAGAFIGLVATLALAGPGVFVNYLDVARASVAFPTALSIQGLAAALGLPVELQQMALIVSLVCASLAIVLLRRRSDVTFAIAVVAAVMATTVVRTETLAVAVAAIAPWATARVSTRPLPRLLSPMVVVTAASWMIAVVAVAVAVTTGGLARTSLSIDNRSLQAVVVRFSVPSQSATFGYYLEPAAAGVAWSDQMGIARSTIYVYTADCRLLQQFPLDSDGATTVRITAAGAERDDPTGGVYLSYTAACAGQVRALLLGEPVPSVGRLSAPK